MSDLPEPALAAFSDDAMSGNLERRRTQASDAYWERRKVTAQPICPDCGMPDSWHASDCPSDTDAL